MLNNGERVINGGFRVTRGATIEVAGTDFAYQRNNGGENLKATGPIDVDVEIEVHIYMYIGLYIYYIICTYNVYIMQISTFAICL